jgi:predicted glutamine amidotransferase
MCVIAVKSENVKISYETVSKMWQANPNGAGLAYFDVDGRVVVNKGFMKLRQAWEAINRLQDKEIVIHFRYATHGRVSPQQTHPFAITHRILDAKAYKSDKTFHSVIFHNGVLPIYGNKEFSDTLDFITSTLVDIPKLRTKLEVLELTGDKFVYMTQNEIYTIGKFEVYEGLDCSNLNFLHTKVSSTKAFTEARWYDGYLYDADTLEYLKQHDEINEPADCYDWLGKQRLY